MINHIDVSSVLRRTVCDLYSNLVTRPTGAAVRTEIENLLSAWRGPSLTVIDFSHVNLLDFSCADEVVAKLLLRYAADTPPDEGYFLFRGVREVHFDAIEAVLERHQLALVLEGEDGAAQLVGAVDPIERAAWQLLERDGRRGDAQVAAALGLDLADAQAVLDTLCRRRVAIRLADGVVAVGLTVLSGRPQ